MTPSISNLRPPLLGVLLWNAQGCRAAKLGWTFLKSNWRKNSIDNFGGYRLVAGGRRNYTMIDGDRFQLDLEDVARRIEDEERRMAG